MTINGLGTSAVDLLNGTGQFNLALDTNVSWIAVAIVAGLIIVLYICHIGGGAGAQQGLFVLRQFLLGLVLGIIALIYEAGRPVSYERECVMQDRLAMQTAKELYKLQRARERGPGQRQVSKGILLA